MKQPVLLGIDIGGTNTDFGLVDMEGNVVFQDQLPTKRYPQPELFLQAIRDAILLELESHSALELSGVGIGAPNANPFEGIIESPPNLIWKGRIPLRDMAYQIFGVEGALHNDANAAALGELYYGMGRNYRDFIVVTLGTGIGGGVIAGGQLLLGRDGLAGEIGHTLAIPEGRLCNCGRKGCFERYASATGLKETIMELLARPGAQSELMDIDFANLTSKRIFEAAQDGDPVALEAFDYTAQIIGRKMAEVAAYFSPEVIIFSGGLANAGDLLLKPAKEYMEKHILFIHKDKIPLVLSELPDNQVAILGAAATLRIPAIP